MNTAVKVEGAKRLVDTFEILKGAVQRRIVRRCVTSAVRPVRQQAKRTTQFKNRTGLLRKSLSIKTRTYKNTGSVVAVVGADRSVQGTYKGKKVVPANYAHLVELGHRTAVSKLSGRSEMDHVLRRRNRPRQILKQEARESTVVKPRPFLANALVIASTEAKDAFARVFQSALESEARKINGRG